MALSHPYVGRVRSFANNKLLLTCFIAIPALATEFYVSPTGMSTGDGSIGRPWNMATVILHPPAVRPGDTINLRTGTYKAPGWLTWNVKLNGAPGAYITIRPYAKEHAVIDGGLQVIGTWLIIRDLEVTNSSAKRVTSQTGPWPSDLTLPTGIDVLGKNVRLINNIVHDTGNGISAWVSAPDTEIYGNILYYSGWKAPDRAHGHGLYLQNQTGQKIVSDNIAFHQFGQGVQIYGSSASYLNNFRVDGNIAFNNGSIVNMFTRNILIGGTAPVNSSVIRNNYAYYPTARNHGGDVNIGYYMGGAGCTNTVFDGNYFVSGGVGLSWWNCNGPSFSGNSIFGELRGLAASSYPGNTFAPVSARPAAQRIFVRPNQYERGRAHIVVYNWPRLATADVDISTAGLSVGDTYEVFDIQNVFGPPVATGTYTGAPVRLPLSLTAMALPVGYAAPPHTDLEFNAFLLRRVDNGIDTGVQPLTLTTPQAAQITTSSAVVAWSTNRTANAQVEYGATTSLGSATPVSPNGTAHSVSLSGLPGGATIYYRVRSVDADGQVAQSGTLSFQTTAPAAAPLTITVPQVTQVTTSSAVVNWSVSRPANGQVEYGPTTALGSATPVSSSVTAHAISLAGLPSGTTIYYRVRSVDANNQAVQSATLSFQTGAAPTATPLTITTPQVTQVTSNSAVVTWSTNRVASSQVQYGTTTSFGSTTPVSGSTIAHSASLFGLPAGTTIYYRVRSVAADGQVAQSATLSLLTSSASAPTTAPNITLVSAVAAREAGTRNVVVTLTLRNTGGPATNVSFKMASLLGRYALQLPSIGPVAGLATVTTTLKFPPTVPSSTGNLSVYITADGVTRTHILSVTVP